MFVLGLRVRPTVPHSIRRTIPRTIHCVPTKFYLTQITDCIDENEYRCQDHSMFT